MSNKHKILVVEDERKIRSFMKAILDTNGYQVVTAGDCVQGEFMYCSHRPDLVLLDLGLPDMDGMCFIQKIRLTDATPIIVLSARTEEGDKVEALDAGANDYITKPFGTAELLARVRATLRNHRYEKLEEGDSYGKYVCRDMEIDYEKRKVEVCGEEIKLTQTEYNIVALLSRHSGRVMTYAAIIRGVWGSADAGSVKKLQVNMANIRKKLGSRPGESKYIINELGVGYRMEDEG
ncbi:MAG: response regulator transcription factor [Eubacteriales bacterium]|nr:response regulator transcription factor [Eubacteriales bacterium]